MTTFQKIMAAVAVTLAVILIIEWRSVRTAEAGPAKLVKDINDHAFGGAPRSDLEPWLSQRGGAVTYEATNGEMHSASVDRVVWHDIRHIGDSHENLLADFYYDSGDHLVYFSMRRVWEKPKK